jgi:hypothetical protein
VTPPVVRRWLSLGLITEPPWTLDRDLRAQVTSRIAGHYRETVFFNPDGSVKRITAHPSFRSTLTSPTTTITTADVGLDRFVENEDGTISIFGTGIHLKLKGGEKAIGLWRLVFDLRQGNSSRRSTTDASMLAQTERLRLFATP